MNIRSKLRAFWKMTTTRVPQKGWEKCGQEVTRPTYLASAFRTLIFGRGRKKRFYVLPTIRQARKLFTKYPLTSNSLFYGTLFVAAEFLQQTWNKGHISSSDAQITKQLDSKPSHARYDSGSIKRYAIWGTLIIPPIYQQWYNWLDAKFQLCEKGPLNRKILAKKMVLDQFLLTPVIVVLFFITMNAMEGKPDWFEECKHKFWKTFAADCCYWLPVQGLNFIYVPADLRVAFIAVATFVWLNVLCWIKSLPISEAKPKEVVTTTPKRQIGLVTQVNATVVDKQKYGTNFIGNEIEK